MARDENLRERVEAMAGWARSRILYCLREEKKHYDKTIELTQMRLAVLESERISLTAVFAQLAIKVPTLEDS